MLDVDTQWTTTNVRYLMGVSKYSMCYTNAFLYIFFLQNQWSNVHIFLGNKRTTKFVNYESSSTHEQPFNNVYKPNFNIYINYNVSLYVIIKLIKSFFSFTKYIQINKESFKKSNKDSLILF